MIGSRRDLHEVWRDTREDVEEMEDYFGLRLEAWSKKLLTALLALGFPVAQRPDTLNARGCPFLALPTPEVEWMQGREGLDVGEARKRNGRIRVRLNGLLQDFYADHAAVLESARLVTISLGIYGTSILRPYQPVMGKGEGTRLHQLHLMRKEFEALADFLRTRHFQDAALI